MSTARDGEQPDGEQGAAWTDPRYAEMVADYYAARRAHPQRDGLPHRGFLYELPADRRPPSA